MKAARVACAKRLVAALLALCWLMMPRPAARPDVEGLLAAAARCGMEAGGFYIYAQRQVRGDGQRLYRGVQRVLEGIPGARAALRQGEGSACVALAILCPPDAFAARQAIGRAQSALGRQAGLMVCLMGSLRAGSPAQGAAALLAAYEGPSLEGVVAETYASFTGERAQAAVRANGEAYLGIPLIPLDY